MRLLLLIALCAVSLSAAEKKKDRSKWDFQNNPFRIDKNFESRFNKLPLSGDMSDVGLGWPGYHWALNKGMIAQRWTQKKVKNFKYESPSLGELKGMSQAQLDQLSPAEKFDIFMGNYDYPTVKRARKQSSKSAGEWTGICHGVSPAGLHHVEPQGKTLVTDHGIKLNFHASDLKALVAYYYAKISKTGITQIGRRCFAGKYNPVKGRACRDVNAGSFHIIMTNRLGITNDGFIADVDRRRKVWNHVAVKFNSKVKSRSGNKVVVESVVDYTGVVKPSVTAILGTENEKWLTKKYEYSLTLDSAGKIIGGEWISKELPDFLWVKAKEKFEHSYYGKIIDLL